MKACKITFLERFPPSQPGICSSFTLTVGDGIKTVTVRKIVRLFETRIYKYNYLVFC